MKKLIFGPKKKIKNIFKAVFIDLFFLERFVNFERLKRFKKGGLATFAKALPAAGVRFAHGK